MYVNNIIELAAHIKHHRKRLFTLGMEVNNNALYYIVFKLHDIEKYIFLPWLWKYYGSKGDKVKARKLYDRMNAVGNVLTNIIFFVLRFSKDDIKVAKRYEKIIDVIDRHCDPVAMEEFNLKEKRPLTNFLPVKDLPLAINFKKKWLQKFNH